MATSTLKEWITERERSQYRTPLFYDNGVLIVYQPHEQPADLIRVPFYHIFTKNKDFFEPITQQIDFDPKFHYQPKKLSASLYNDIALWHILLILNKCRSEVDFVGDKVWILDPGKVNDYMTRMFVDNEIKATIMH